MSLEYRIGDVWERIREIPDGSIDLIVTSPPFLALRSYLPADHPDKAREIGSEATPADFLDTLLGLSAEFGRVLAPSGSICVELGDTYSGSGGGGGDYLPGGMREGQANFAGSAATARESNAAHWRSKNRGGQNGRASMVENATGGHHMGGVGWPLAKSLTGIPTLYPWSLAYGRNLLTGQPSPAGQWRIRNVIVWARPNPPVGALGDKFRPATSYITVACRGARRYFDLDAVRTDLKVPEAATLEGARYRRTPSGSISGFGPGGRADQIDTPITSNPAGAPPLDWHTDHHPEDGDWLWKLSTQPYKGSHYATFPLALPKRLIEAMCPLRVCTVCGRPSERIVEHDHVSLRGASERAMTTGLRRGDGVNQFTATDGTNGSGWAAVPTTLGWSDCGHDAWRTGRVLDPFGGSGTTAEAAQAVGRHAICIDLDARNADLARERCGMFLEIVDPSPTVGLESAV